MLCRRSVCLNRFCALGTIRTKDVKTCYSNYGFMFSIRAKKKIKLTEFEFEPHVNGSFNYTLYWRRGGYAKGKSGWNAIVTRKVDVQGDVMKRFPSPIDRTLFAGETIGLFLHSPDSSEAVGYANRSKATS